MRSQIGPYDLKPKARASTCIPPVFGDVTNQKPDQSPDDSRIVHPAARACRADSAAVLVKAGACVDALDGEWRLNQCPLLLVAAASGPTAVINVLIDGGATVEHQTPIGRHTPPHMALSVGHKDATAALLRVGANVCHCNKDKWCALTLAWAAGDTPRCAVQNGQLHGADATEHRASASRHREQSAASLRRSRLLAKSIVGTETKPMEHGKTRNDTGRGCAVLLPAWVHCLCAPTLEGALRWLGRRSSSATSGGGGRRILCEREHVAKQRASENPRVIDIQYLN